MAATAFHRVLALLLLLLLTAFGAAAHRQRLSNATILVSLDGFHPAYLDRGVTPAINQLAAAGVRAPRVITTFTTKTFPNHYTLVTGLYAETHGIVSNTMYDPVFDERFTISDPDAVTDAKWWGGEPVWNTLMKNGYLTACYFWPGSEAPIQGMRPTYYKTYDGSVPNEQRVSEVVQWLLLPEDERPSFVTLYFSTVDDYGHEFGPSSPDVEEGLRIVDNNIDQLMMELQTHGLRETTNIIIVSDHGMAGVSNERERYLDDYIDLDLVDIVEVSVLPALIPINPADEEAIYSSLLAGAQRDGHFQPYWKNGSEDQQMPERLYYSDHIRIAPIVIVMEVGWTMQRSRLGARAHHAHGPTSRLEDTGGNHGYDNEASEMDSLFVAGGPSFNKGVVVDPFPNVEVYNLLCAIYDVQPAPNNGTLNSKLIQQALAT